MRKLLQKQIQAAFFGRSFGKTEEACQKNTYLAPLCMGLARMRPKGFAERKAPVSVRLNASCNELQQVFDLFFYMEGNMCPRR
jgi:hypothetical protein